MIPRNLLIYYPPWGKPSLGFDETCAGPWTHGPLPRDYISTTITFSDIRVSDVMFYFLLEPDFTLAHNQGWYSTPTPDCKRSRDVSHANAMKAQKKVWNLLPYSLYRRRHRVFSFVITSEELADGLKGDQITQRHGNLRFEYHSNGPGLEKPLHFYTAQDIKLGIFK